MILQEIYKKDITRTVNPAVSATKLDAETKKVEIEEYVFTDEIINGLYKILKAIKNNKDFSHIGMWIDGYYGTGKSHFLKYFDYCITKETQEQAMKRLIDAVAKIDPFTDTTHNIECDVEELKEIERWLKTADIETCIFNLETSYDNTIDRTKGFIHVFWNEFNALRGFNKFNITLAQHLEKPLQQKGVFEEFKAAIAEMGGNWDDPNDAADLIDNETDTVLEIAKELAPSLSIDSIKERIIKRDTTISIEKFAAELFAYIKDKGENYRLIMLADEVSQFINKQHDRFLNLQEIITKLSEECDNKVWIACTAQQDLSEVMDDCQVAEERDHEGKIKGRFEVKVSLKGSKTDVIVQKRILDKKDDIKPLLGKLYDEKKTAIDAQYQLPRGYETFTSKENFIDYYPFVPYQFVLIKQVFNSFLNLGYVAKEIKGSERSIIKVVHSTAKNTKDENVGRFIAFDELYNSMFEEGLQARGQKAIDNAIRIIHNYKDEKFGIRVVNVLFMICNISATDKLVFPATVANITNLLLTDIDTPKLTLKTQVQDVVDYLCENHIIRLEQGKQGAPDTYEFLSEEEMNVASLIASQKIDNETTAENLKEIFLRYFNIKNKVQYVTRSFRVGCTIKLRNYLDNTPDIVIDFELDKNHPDVNTMAIQNSPTHLVFYIAELYQGNKRLTNDFYSYCQSAQYMKTAATTSENNRIREEFAKRALENFNNVIVPAFHKILDSCPIVSGQNILDDPNLSTKRGAERYQIAVTRHMENLYPKANLVDDAKIPTTNDVLRAKINSTIQPGDYDGLNAALTRAEQEVEIYLNNQFAEVKVSDITTKFAKAPYGWNDTCTLYIVNELVRRHKREYSYENNPNVETSLVASRLVSETNKFTVRQATAISQEVINNFTAAWRHIFGHSDVFASNDSTAIFRQCRDKDSDRGLCKRRDSYKVIEANYSSYPFIKPIRNMYDMFEKWLDERDPLKFFNKIINEQDDAAKLMDKCKEIVQFIHDQMPKYIEIIKFAADNNENFASMPEEDQPKGKRLKELKDEEWPIDKMHEFNRLKNEVTAILDKVKTELREKIKKEYNDVFDKLEESAKENDVPISVISPREATIAIKCQSNSIATLKLNLQTDEFYVAEVTKILNYVKEHTQQPQTDEPSSPAPAPGRTTVTMSLHTKTTVPLKTSSEVDNYLEKIRRQIMAEINNGKSVMIIK